MKQLGIFLSPLDGMLVHHRVTPALTLPVPICTPGPREALRVKCLAQEHNMTMSPTRALAQTAQSGDEHNTPLTLNNMCNKLCESLYCTLERENLGHFTKTVGIESRRLQLVQLHIQNANIVQLPFVVHGQRSRDRGRERPAHKDTNGSVHH